MSELHHIIIPALLAFLGTLWVHPKVLKIAILKNLVDNPDARKLQRNPVPVMGGIAVFFGIIIGLCSSLTMFNSPNLFMLISAMLIMLYIGTIDDILDLSPAIRFAIEILIIMWLMYVNSSSINNFWGLWGLGIIPDWISWPLTIFAAVGIINAINLIDGVNGLSSGFCFMASVLFAILFYSTGNTVMSSLSISAAGAIIPFFLHNVFGYKTRMFIGDGGTLVIGTMMSMFVINILSSNSLCTTLALKGLGLVPFTLAVLSIPVFDTLRVMSMRIIRGTSPFHPDKTHLHHIFLELGFSHIGTTFSILSMNLFIVAAWFISYKLGASVDIQLYIVLALSILATFVFYKFARNRINNNSKGLKRLQKIAKALNFEKKGIWLTIQQLIHKLYLHVNKKRGEAHRPPAAICYSPTTKDKKGGGDSLTTRKQEQPSITFKTIPHTLHSHKFIVAFTNRLVVYIYKVLIFSIIKIALRVHLKSFIRTARQPYIHIVIHP